MSGLLWIFLSARTRGWLNTLVNQFLDSHNTNKNHLHFFSAICFQGHIPRSCHHLACLCFWKLLFYFILIFKSFYIIFEGYSPFTVVKVITKYWLYSPHSTVHPWVYLTPNSLYLPLPNPCIAPPPPSPLVTTSLILYICESASFLLDSLVCCIF